jgi:hypothetical protein
MKHLYLPVNRFILSGGLGLGLGLGQYLHAWQQDD